tara:strand:+ start:600 stop:1058 length:459 start_codon:yes stop_codon:yes gene_type:complete
MDCNNYEDKIISYIENKLDAKEKVDFELELSNNSDLKAEYVEMKNILNSLNQMPEIKASSDFLVNLNEKIDNYELKSSNNSFSSFFNKLINYDYLPHLSLGAASLVCLFIINFFWDSNDHSNSQIMLSNSSEHINDSVANLDSLNEEKDIDK